MSNGKYLSYDLTTFVHACRYDELVVGSPLYRDGPGSPEAGRVYVYRNTGVSDLDLWKEEPGAWFTLAGKL